MTEGAVVVGVDGSRNARVALEWAADEARRRGVPLRVVHAWAMPFTPAALGFPAPEAQLRAAAEDGARRTLDREVAALGAPGVEVQPRLVEAAPVPALLAAAGEGDLLVVGSRGRGILTDALLGSVGRQVAHESRCPVTVVPDRRPRAA